MSSPVAATTKLEKSLDLFGGSWRSEEEAAYSRTMLRWGEKCPAALSHGMEPRLFRMEYEVLLWRWYGGRRKSSVDTTAGQQL
jgi:hypothetical protein